MPSRKSARDGREAFVQLMTVAGAAQQVLKDEMRLQQLEELGPLHMRLLCICLERPGLTQQQLADKSGRDRSQVAHLVRALEKEGLLTRTADPVDGRILRLEATPDGGILAGRFMAVESDVARRLFGKLSKDDLALLRDLVARMELSEASLLP